MLTRATVPRGVLQESALRNFAKFTGKHHFKSLFFNKVAGNFIKKETLAQVFSSEFYEISKNTFFIEHLFWLLLAIQQVPKCLNFEEHFSFYLHVGLYVF